MSSALLLLLLVGEAWLCRSIVAAAWDGARRGDAVVRAALGFGLWAACVSVGTYASARLAWFGAASWPGHAVVVAGLLLASRGMTRQAVAAAEGCLVATASTPGPPVRRLLAIAAVVAMLAALAGGTLHVLANPHGGYDAWWMWNTKARVMHLHEGAWSELVATVSGLGHPDYPLLLPGLVAAGLDLCGADTVAVPIAAAAAFAVATVGLVAGVLRAERSWALACTACVCLCGYHRFVAVALDQTADVPLALYLAGGLALLERGLVTRRRATTVLGGVFLGAAAWTKNEGILALTAVLVAGALVLVRRHDARAPAGALALVLAGALPGLALAATWKASVPTENDLVGAWTSGALSHVLDPARYPAVLQSFAVAISRWSSGVVLVIGALVAASVWTRPLAGVASRAWQWLALSAVTIVAGFFLVFVTTPAEQQWHLDTALPRLLAQLWPAFVMIGLLRIDERLLIPRASGGEVA